MTTTDDDIDGPPGDKKMPLLEHLVELRQRLMWAALAFFIAFLVCYAFHKQIFSILIAPMNALPNPEGRRMIFTAPTEAFFTYIKLAMWGAVCLSFPIVAGQVWKFVAPGLYQHEKNAFLPFLVATPFMFALGAGFLYFLILPYGLQFFASFEIPRDAATGTVPIQFEAKMNEYLSFVMALILAFGISFELPVLLVLLVKVGILTTEQLATKRRYAAVAMVTFAAIVTPPDVFSQLALAIPMYLLYELSIIIGRFVERSSADEEDEDEPEPGASPVKSSAGAPSAAARPAAPRPQVYDENDFNLAR
jgi:sec-independent protein translocase protein TatC